MKFSRRRPEEPEINLIPFIDVLLVVLIFLMLSTTYSRFTELRINLPAANSDRMKERPGELIVGINAEGQYSLNRKPVDGRSVEVLTAELTAAAAGNADAVVVISADAMAAHQAVINIMDAARRAGLSRLTFAAQSPSGGAASR
jgi:biopolymer transport protein ExbD